MSKYTNQHMICTQWLTYQGLNFGFKRQTNLFTNHLPHALIINYVKDWIYYVCNNCFTLPHCNMHFFSYYTQMKQMNVHYQSFCKFLFMIDKQTTSQVLWKNFLLIIFV